MADSALVRAIADAVTRKDYGAILALMEELAAADPVLAEKAYQGLVDGLQYRSEKRSGDE